MVPDLRSCLRGRGRYGLPRWRRDDLQSHREQSERHLAARRARRSHARDWFRHAKTSRLTGPRSSFSRCEVESLRNRSIFLL